MTSVLLGSLAFIHNSLNIKASISNHNRNTGIEECVVIRTHRNKGKEDGEALVVNDMMDSKELSRDSMVKIKIYLH